MFSRIYTGDIEIIRLFINECKICLESLEKELLKLEVNFNDTEIIDLILKRIQSIKRGASFAGMPAIVRLCRGMELILDAIREGRLTVDAALIDSMLSFVDFLNTCFAELSKKLDDNAKNDSGYLEFDDVLDGERVLESLNHAYKNKVKTIESAVYNEQSPEDLDIIQPEELKMGQTEGIREQFLVECTEHIEKIENDLLLRLDSNSGDREAVNGMFRAVHSIKGGTGMYLATLIPKSQEYSNVKNFSEVAHTFESLMAIIRDKSCGFDGKLVDLSFNVMDFFKSFLKSVSDSRAESLQHQEILEAIKAEITRVQSLAAEIPQNAPDLPSQLIGSNDDNKSKNSMSQSIRVSQEKIDKMMNMISELIIAKNSFIHISEKLNLDYNLPEISKEVKQVGAYINRISDELQNAIMSIRMVEIKTVFQRVPRVIRDIAHNTGKKMELHIEGENTEIDKTIIEIISDPMLHLVRNAADHGIEPPAERLAKGKPETGRITLRAYNKNKNVYIEIEDDGKGIDADELKKKAVQKGFISSAEAEKMSRSQLLNLIFLPGFSTAKQVTEISGRGVGMDIVKSNISKINGSVMIESEVDKGTKMIIQLPLSLAVSHGLIVTASGDSYIIPLDYIVETVKIKRNSIHSFNGKCFSYFRGNVIRVEWLSRIFQTGDRDDGPEELNAVILSNGEENFAIVVDRLKNEQEFVVKTLEGHLADIPGISGSTLLGNGQVVLIVNPADLLQLMEK